MYSTDPQFTGSKLRGERELNEGTSYRKKDTELPEAEIADSRCGGPQ